MTEEEIERKAKEISDALDIEYYDVLGALRRKNEGRDAGTLFHQKGYYASIGSRALWEEKGHDGRRQRKTQE